MKKTTLFLLLIWLSIGTIFAQTTEDFESETIGGATFTNNGQNFTVNSQVGVTFDIYNSTNAGWNGTARDNRFIDNSDFALPGQPVQFTISSNGQVPFYLKSIYLFLSNYNLDQPTPGASITITAKLNGTTVYTTTSNTGFNSNPAVNNGYTFIDFTTFGGSNNANTLIDEYEITSTGDIEYIALDAMRWQIDCTAATTPNAAAAQTFCIPATVANLVASGSGTIKWYDVATGGTALLNTEVLTAKSYYVSNTVGACESERVEVSVTLNTTSAPTASTPQVFVGTATIANLTATGSGLKWYESQTGGSPLANATALVDGTIYYVSQTLNSCESTRTVVNVKRIGEASQTLCNPATVADLASTVTTGTTANWFTTASGGTALEPTTSINTGTYHVEQTQPSTATTVRNDFNQTVAVALQADGKILVADRTTGIIKRMNADGTGIELLGSGLGLTFAIAVQSDGKILVAEFSTGLLKRMNADGTGIVTLASGLNRPRGIAIQNDGKILIASQTGNSVFRLNADGTGIVTVGSGFTNPYGVAVLSDGKIIIADTGNSAIKRMNIDGTGIVTLATGFTALFGVAVHPGDKILFTAGSSSTIKRINADGSGLVTIESGATNPIGVVFEANGKILIGNLNGSNVNRITEAKSTNRVSVNVTVNTPEAPTATAQTFCDAATVANLEATGSGTIKWYDVATGGTVLDSTTALTNGNYFASQTIDGCESERTQVSVTLTPSTENTTTITSCDTYTWSNNGQTYTTSGIYIGTTTNCVTEKLDLTITPSTTNTTTVTSCDSYTWPENGTTYTESGNYPVVNGCNTEILVLTITPSTTNTITITSCDTYTWANSGQTYTTSGIYTGTTTNCVTEKLDLTITPSTTNTIIVTACDSYLWAQNGVTYTESGNYQVVNGCTTEILALTITSSTTNTTTITSCDTYTWAENGTTYTESGSYTVVNGCNTEILALTITPRTTNTTTVASCDSYTWAENGTTYTESGNYQVVNGCNTEILALTINPSTTNTTTIATCSSYYWSVNDQAYTTSGTYTFVNGCVTEILNVTITPAPDNSVTQSGDNLTASETNATYQWGICGIKDNFTPIASATSQSYLVTTSGKYAVEITKNGCTSISDCFNVTTLSNTEFDKNEFQYFPNPVVETLNMRYNKNISNVQIFDLTGRIVKSVQPNTTIVEISLTELASAMYIVKLQSEDNKQMEIKIVKK